MKQNKFFIEHAVHLATACAVLAIILIIPAAATKFPTLGVCLTILSVLLLIAGGVILYFRHRLMGSAPVQQHAKTSQKAPKPTENDAADGEMTFADVLAGIDEYLGEDAASISDMRLDIPRDLRVRLEEEQIFRPLIAMRLLWELSGRSPEEITEQFVAADEKSIGYLCGAVYDAGEADLADFIYKLKQNAEAERARIPSVFRKNRHYFENRMIAYVSLHMDEFGSDEE